MTSFWHSFWLNLIKQIDGYLTQSSHNHQNCFYMFMLSIIFTITIINLLKMISEDGVVIYKDVRFWVVLVSLIILVTITATSQNL